MGYKRHCFICFNKNMKNFIQLFEFIKKFAYLCRNLQKLLKAYKYRIFPNEEQKSKMVNIFGQVRFVYNLGLETKITAYAGSKTNLNCFDLINQVVELKKHECPFKCWNRFFITKKLWG